MPMAASVTSPPEPGQCKIRWDVVSILLRAADQGIFRFRG